MWAPMWYFQHIVKLFLPLPPMKKKKIAKANGIVFGISWTYVTFLLQISSLFEISQFYAFGTLNLSYNNLSWHELARIPNVIILDLHLIGNPELEKVGEDFSFVPYKLSDLQQHHLTHCRTHIIVFMWLIAYPIYGCWMDVLSLVRNEIKRKIFFMIQHYQAGLL